MKSELDQLFGYLKGRGKVAIALSGGLDSSVLLAFAVSALGEENCLAITAKTPYMMAEEMTDSVELCRRLGVRHVVVEMPIADNLRNNPHLRCYLCKSGLFHELFTKSREFGFDYLLDGTNLDDESDYRPGQQALRELGVGSPFRDAGMGKNEIRALGRQLGLPDQFTLKPAYACLLTRFEHGADITEAAIERVDLAERFLRKLGYASCRVRVQGDTARIEVDREQVAHIADPAISSQIIDYFTSIGFSTVSLDLQGYKRGKMNKPV